MDQSDFGGKGLYDITTFQGYRLPDLPLSLLLLVGVVPADSPEDAGGGGRGGGLSDPDSEQCDPVHIRMETVLRQHFTSYRSN